MIAPIVSIALIASVALNDSLNSSNSFNSFDSLDRLASLSSRRFYSVFTYNEVMSLATRIARRLPRRPQKRRCLMVWSPATQLRGAPPSLGFCFASREQVCDLGFCEQNLVYSIFGDAQPEDRRAERLGELGFVAWVCGGDDVIEFYSRPNPKNEPCAGDFALGAFGPHPPPNDTCQATSQGLFDTLKREASALAPACGPRVS